MSENKIIKFPIDKVKPPTNKKATFGQHSQHLKRITPAITFVILAMYVPSNALFFTQTKEKVSLRKLASLGSLSEFQRDVAWEHRLAKQLAMKSQKRGIASVGTSPLLQDQLTAGFLHNKYRVEFVSGKITNIELAETLENVNPTYIDSYHFLRSYKRLMPIKYQYFEKASSVKQESKILETFELLDKDSNVKGLVKFELDSFGRLLAMKVQKNS